MNHTISSMGIPRDSAHPENALARRWAMSPRTLERWRWTGGGPRYLKVGKRIVYRLEDVEAFEAVRLHESTSSPLGAQQPRAK